MRFIIEEGMRFIIEDTQKVEKKLLCKFIIIDYIHIFTKVAISSKNK